jgi:hypothetical protein
VALDDIKNYLTITSWEFSAAQGFYTQHPPDISTLFSLAPTPGCTGVWAMGAGFVCWILPRPKMHAGSILGRRAEMCEMKNDRVWPKTIDDRDRKNKNEVLLVWDEPHPACWIDVMQDFSPWRRSGRNRDRFPNVKAV